MKAFTSHKRVFAGQIIEEPFWHQARDGWVFMLADEAPVERLVTDAVYQRITKMAQEAGLTINGGYLISYEDGYVSWSPPGPFENGYIQDPEPDAEPADLFGFDVVVRGLIEGKRYARRGWNGKDMFIFMVPGSQFEVSRPPLLGIYPEGTPITYRAHVDMRMADGSISVWTVAQPDVLAHDWMEV